MAMLTASAAEFLDAIDLLLERDLPGTDRGFLMDVASTVRRMNHVTDGQRRAVQSIAAGRRELLPSERFMAKQSRRYEGYERSR